MNSRQPHDADADRDAANSEAYRLLEGPQETRQPPSSDRRGRTPAAGPTRRTSGLPAAPRTRRQPGPDSNMGLAVYFNNACPSPNWAHGMQLNSMRGMAAMMRELRDHGLDADAIRALIDLYFDRLGDRVPRLAYWLDFKGSRWSLLRAADTTGATRTAQGYDAWTAPTSTEDDPRRQLSERFAAGWGAVRGPA